MRPLILAALLLATPAMADEPTTVILPTQVVSAVAQYLSQRPYSEVSQMMTALQQCVLAQVPDKDGALHGDCPAVTAAKKPADRK